MKVNLAAQIFSSSVAEALEYLQEAGHPDLQGASRTITFIRKIDRLFDLLNSRSAFGNRLKAPMQI